MNIVWFKKKKKNLSESEKNPAREESDLHNCSAAAFEVLSSGGGFGWRLGEQK